MSTPHAEVITQKCECGDYIVERQAMRIDKVADMIYPETEFRVEQCLKCKFVWLIPIEPELTTNENTEEKLAQIMAEFFVKSPWNNQ